MNVIEGGVKNIEQMENNNLTCRQSQKGENGGLFKM
jgi:hypothetical protein